MLLAPQHMLQASVDCLCAWTNQLPLAPKAKAEFRPEPRDPSSIPFTRSSTRTAAELHVQLPFSESDSAVGFDFLLPSSAYKMCHLH